ncbi:hypothetical protein [Cribrihabitans neustonicus]|uniref:hypothetical protein n=1 Tax=Cribrihabitans neustonicus TaxID=1429085 RepID=UPI003B59C57F
MRIKAALACAMMAGQALAQAPAEEPLSAIGWLKEKPQRSALPGTVLLEPPVTGSAATPPVTVTPLENLPAPIGLVPPSATGLPVGLWRGSAPNEVAQLIETVPVRRSPAMQALLFTLLLSETRAPAEGGDRILLARINRLIALGATDPAQALLEHAGAAASRERFARWFDTTLLTGSEERSCKALADAPHLAPGYPARIFCAMRGGDWSTAALLLETAATLEVLPQAQLELLDRFLNPDFYEQAPPLAPPAAPDPLTFRLYESIGEPLPTAPLPPAFAAADLRDLAGWKAQLEAAERLTRNGALPPNQLLGLFSTRKPAASGGVWDRVSALQTFEAALERKDREALDRALPRAWEAMQAAGLETAFAELFADRLARAGLEGPSAALAWRIRLLSPSYELAAHGVPDDGAESRFLAALARGRPGDATAPSALAGAIAEGFQPGTPVPYSLQKLLDNGQLGEAILRSMVQFAHGADGNLDELSTALAAFRAVGLEDTARRAALQLMLLERR